MTASTMLRPTTGATLLLAAGGIWPGLPAAVVDLREAVAGLLCAAPRLDPRVVVLLRPLVLHRDRLRPTR